VRVGWSLGASFSWADCCACRADSARVVARLNTCEASGSYSLAAKTAEARRASLSAAVSGWAVWVWSWSLSVCVWSVWSAAAVWVWTGPLICESAGVPPSRDCGPPMKEIKLRKVKAVNCSATIRAAPSFFTVRRISLLIFFPKGCGVRECSGGLGLGGKGVFWGLGGWGVKVLVRVRLGVIAPVAATAAPPWRLTQTPYNVAGFCRAFL